MKHVIIRELRRMRSDSIYLLSVLLIPCCCVIFFLTLFHEGLPTALPVAVIDNDNTSLSRNFIRQVDAMQMIDITLKCENFAAAEQEMRKGNIYAFILIPRDFQAQIMTGRQPKLTFYYHNAFFIPGSLLLKDLITISAVFTAGVSLNTAQAKGISPINIMTEIQPVVVDPHLIGNPFMNYSVYMSNVIIPGLIMLMLLFITIYAVGVEMKEHTAREWLILSGKSIMKALCGKLLPYTVVFTLIMLLNDLLLFRILHFPLRGEPFTMLSATLLLVLATQALGVFLIGALPVLRKALSVAAVLGLLSVSLTGFSFPVEQMLIFIRPLANLLPLRHYFLIYQNTALNGIPFYYSLSSYVALMLFLLLPFMILIRLKKALIHNNYV